MNSLTDIYGHISAQDAELEKQASEIIKQAEEEDAAGRIMARGFADELNKLAAPPGPPALAGAPAWEEAAKKRARATRAAAAPKPPATTKPIVVPKPPAPAAGKATIKVSR